MFMDEGDNAVLHIESITYQCKGWLHNLQRYSCIISLHSYLFRIGGETSEGATSAKKRGSVTNDFFVNPNQSVV